MARAATALACLLLVAEVQGSGFDHSHAAWTKLLGRHVVLIDGGNASQVRYRGFQTERAELQRYMDTLSAVSASELQAWTKAEQLAFLINAYNAFTVKLILTRYPDLASIRDFGRFFNNPWKQPFFKLLGQDQNLDGIEHEMIRAPGVYDEPRIHMAVNCASIGCPMLREEAYVGERLAAQLDDQVRRFLSDRTRNRYDPATRTLWVSELFEWYGEDFGSGYQGIVSPEVFFGRYAAALSDDSAGQEVIRKGEAGIRYLEYDWALNDFKGG